MDVDLESVEIVFAQKLACGEPPIRARALRTLQNWIKQQSAKTPFAEKDFMRLWKGLHYVMWMQDKMLMQEELADKIANLIEIFETEEERVMYFECMIKSLSKEWKAIDRWRMDKFLMLLRRCVRVVFHYLRDHNWAKDKTQMYIDALKRTVISLDKTIPEGFKFHFASLLLDELDLAGNISQESVYNFLEPFFVVLANPATSRYLFDSILDEIFSTILLHYTKQLENGNVLDAEGDENEDNDEVEDEDEEEEEIPACARMDENLEGRESIQFDYERIGKALFNIGKDPKCISERRRKLYTFAKKFELAASSKNPYYEKEYEPEVLLTEEMVEEAAMKLSQAEKRNEKERKEFKKSKKYRAAVHALTLYPELISDDSGEKLRKQMKKEQKTLKKARLHKLEEGGHVKKPKVKKSGKVKEKDPSLSKKKSKGKTKKRQPVA